MSSLKRILAFFAALFITVCVIACILFWVENNEKNQLFSFDENGSFTVMGEAFSPDKKVAAAISAYTKKCDAFCSSFLPTIFSRTMKITAENLFSAVKMMVLGACDSLNHFIYGNM